MKRLFFFMMVWEIGVFFSSAYGQNYVDLGLSSGTKWSDTNEDIFYNYYDAVIRFGNKLPTKEQWEELYNECEWKWRETGDYLVTGPNGKSITLPAAGYRACYGRVRRVASNGYYWSSSPRGSDYAWYLFFNSRGLVSVWFNPPCNGNSVRLVKD